MRAGISVQLTLVFFAASLGCEEVRVRPEGLDELGVDTVDDVADDEPPAIGDLELPEPRRPVAIAAGYYNTCAVLGDGRVACFGDNRAAFGIGEAEDQLSIIDGAAARRGITLGKRRGCAWEGDDGALLCWPGSRGQPRALGVNMPHVKQSSLGGGHLCSVLTDGHVRCIWDDNWSQSQSAFSHRQWWVDGVENVVEVATGATHTCVRHEDGGVTCWGDNRSNQMGDGSDRVRARPRQVPDLEGATQIASHHLAALTCALRSDGVITCWGSYGVERAGGTTRLGDSSETLPRIESGRITEIGVGPWEVCARTDGGEVYCYRQSLASARGASSSVYGTPERVAGIVDATSVTVGAMHACALLEDGDVACWGENTYGQLGDGTREERDGAVLSTALRAVARGGGDGS